MTNRIAVAIALLAGLVAISILERQVDACFPAGPPGAAIVNADQTVIILWDPVAKTQHFIRKASFASSADDFGFIIPSPNQPELAEAGDAAFSHLREVTAPEIKYVPIERSTSVSHGEAKKSEDKKDFVRVLEKKRVAGFDAVVLEASSAAALVRWLEENGYSFSKEVENWAKPYVDASWKFTALKVVKDDRDRKSVSADALRMSFKTDQPLFPYREPDSYSAVDKLGAKRRLLRIYFISDRRYEGTFTKEKPWSGAVAWAGKMTSDQRAQLLDHLKLPATTTPAEWFLTEFEDDWPYAMAESDVTFSPSANQDSVRRPPIVQYYYVDPPPRPGMSPLILGGFAAALFIAFTAYILDRRRRG